MSDEAEDTAATMLDVLDEILTELKLLNAREIAGSQQAKVEIKTSTRGADITVACYEQSGDLVPIGDKAMAEFVRVARRTSPPESTGSRRPRSLGGWQHSWRQSCS